MSRNEFSRTLFTTTKCAKKKEIEKINENCTCIRTRTHKQIDLGFCEKPALSIQTKRTLHKESERANERV